MGSEAWRGPRMSYSGVISWMRIATRFYKQNISGASFSPNDLLWWLLIPKGRLAFNMCPTVPELVLPCHDSTPFPTTPWCNGDSAIGTENRTRDAPPERSLAKCT